MRKPPQPDGAGLRAAEIALEELGGNTGAARGVLVYPQTYHIGMSNLAVHALLRAFAHGGLVCERAFLPPEDELAHLRTSGRPLTSFETGAPLRDFDFVAITCPFELDYLNIPLMLQLGGIEPLACDRDPRDPLILMGGPALTANPQPMAAFADAVMIGEIEPVESQLCAILASLRETSYDRPAAMRELHTLAGMYVPSLQDPQRSIERVYADNLDSFPTCSVILTPHNEFPKRFLVEVGRGCGRGCRFCMASSIYWPMRVRHPERVMNAIQPALAHTDLVGLVGAALSDYPWIDQICGALREVDASVSVSSVRAESVTSTLLETLAASGQRSVTYAPEAGSEELRRAIGKGMSDAQLFAAIERAADAGLREIKLYFMLGLTEDAEAETDQTIALVEKLCDAFPSLGFTVSSSPFTPKPHTALQLATMLPIGALRRAGSRLGTQLRRRKHVTVRLGSPRWALAQTAFSRGGRELAPAILRASLSGGAWQGLNEAMVSCGLSLEAYRSPTRDETGRCPWDIVDNTCARRQGN